MLRMQVLGHASVRGEVKGYLRSSGALQIEEVSLDEAGKERPSAPSGHAASAFEAAESAIGFLSGFSPAPSMIEKLSGGPIETTPEEVHRLENEHPVFDAARRCDELRVRIRSAEDRLERSRLVVSQLAPWSSLSIDLGDAGTELCTVEFWTLPGKNAPSILDLVEREVPLSSVETAGEHGGRTHAAVIVVRSESERVAELLKEHGGVRVTFSGLEGGPARIIEAERESWPRIEEEIRSARDEAASMAGWLDGLRVLSDHYRELMGLEEIEPDIFRTDSAFVIEGWVRARDRKRLERGLSGRFDETELSFREPREDEEVPIALSNRPVLAPYEFVTTLYGRPRYGETDPTPMLAPFFVLFFAMCLTDAGYGITLAALSGFALLRFRPSGGAAKLFRVLLMGGLVTAAVGLLAGGVFGLGAEHFPSWLRGIVLIDPLKEPMKMLNISFLLGLVHMIFGMGISMKANLEAGLVSDAIFGDLAWMIFIAALAPLGYAGILGGEVPPAVMDLSVYASIAMAAVILFTGGRAHRSPVKRLLGGLVKFYDVVGYFGDVLSYARLLALGLATSAIALAVNDIARMVTGLPWYTGYVAMVLILVGGHLFNLAVNTLGSFVHSGRLQYLEFFSKFFRGGGKEFRPYRSDRRYSVLRDSD